MDELKKRIVMVVKGHAHAYVIALLIAFCATKEAVAKVLCNLTKFDPYPIFSTMYPYDYVAYREKIEAFDKRMEIFEEDRFRLSVSGFRQKAFCANNTMGQLVNIADLPNGLGINFTALFFDPLRAEQLAKLLGIQATAFIATTPEGEADCPAPTTTSCPDQPCFDFIRTPANTDRMYQFGFTELPSIYTKYGARFESELLLIDNCADAVGLRMQLGVADVRLTVTQFNDLTCTASGLSCNAATGDNTCPTANSCCFSFTCPCKSLVIQKITQQESAIAKFLGYDLCNTYHKVGVEDPRLALFWRHIYDLNPDDVPDWPRLLFMPFVEFGVSAPMSKRVSPSEVFGIPLSNNGHTSIGSCAGFTLDFLDSVDIAVEAGFTYFFEQSYCNYPLPTNELESGLFPYRADYNVRPGITWDGAVTLNAYQFLERLSFWVQYMIIHHSEDKICVCRSLIPEQSAFSPEFNPATTLFQTEPSLETNRSFLTEFAECTTKYEVHFVNFAFNYDIAPHVNIGVLAQVPIRPRNAPFSTTILGSINMTF